MRTQISGRQIDVGQALQTHVTDEIGTILGKYSQRPTDAQVVFSKSGHEYVCESEVHLSTGMSVQARGRAAEIYAAFDACGEKMDKQLRRYKRRLKDHHRTRPEQLDGLPATAYVLAAEDGQDDVEADEPGTLDPVIIAESRTSVPRLSVGEAVMQMELNGAPALVFLKEGREGLNVVYRREDGNIGWIDPGISG
jgi:ribosomal subunit interface protein